MNLQNFLNKPFKFKFVFYPQNPKSVYKLRLSYLNWKRHTHMNIFIINTIFSFKSLKSKPNIYHLPSNNTHTFHNKLYKDYYVGPSAILIFFFCKIATQIVHITPHPVHSTCSRVCVYKYLGITANFMSAKPYTIDGKWNKYFISFESIYRG